MASVSNKNTIKLKRDTRPPRKKLLKDRNTQ